MLFKNQKNLLLVQERMPGFAGYCGLKAGGFPLKKALEGAIDSGDHSFVAMMNS
jgi:hypothetical protein